MDKAWEILAWQIPVAVLFAIFAVILIRIFMDFIREQRKEYLESLEKITGRVEDMSDAITNLDKTVSGKRRI